MPKYLAASSLVSTSFEQLIMFAEIRSATCFNSSLIVFVLRVGAVRGSGETSAPVFAHALSGQGVSRAVAAVSRCKEIKDRKQKAPTIAHCGDCRGVMSGAMMPTQTLCLSGRFQTDFAPSFECHCNSASICLVQFQIGIQKVSMIFCYLCPNSISC